jgi:hypothetical protein
MKYGLETILHIDDLSFHAFASMIAYMRRGL